MKFLFEKLDLSQYLNEFNSLLAREKSVFLQGDSTLHFKRIQSLAKMDFNPPPNVKNLDTELAHLSKQGVLHLEHCFEFVKICLYFRYLKGLKFEDEIASWLDKIDIENELLDIAFKFSDKGELKEESDERLRNLNLSLRLKREQIKAEFKKIAYTKALAPYLIDTQIHLINEEEALLVRGGFNHVLKANVIARSSSGGFYIVPAGIESLNNELLRLKNEKEAIFYEYAKSFSALFYKHLRNLSFLNKAFDIFDSYAARVILAKKKDLEFVLSTPNSKQIVLKNFIHPILKQGKSVSVSFTKQVLIITGVNAGGKTMLLKSICTACLLSKYLLPMHIKASESRIGSFKDFALILEDPQNAKNDISTFAGRMLAFSKLFNQKDLLLEVDEIELGTDFEEASSLYSVLIEKLILQGVKIVLTTHHKRLAFLLAKNEQVELMAALYDEKLARPKYEFLQGIIGKSYAFETALRYGVSSNLIAEAKKRYGEDKENLKELVSKSIHLELELKTKLRALEQKELRANELLKELKEQKQVAEISLKNELSHLENEYFKASEEAKKSIRLSDIKDKQRALNMAFELKKSIQKPKFSKPDDLKIGDFVKYGKLKGVVKALHKNEASIESGGIVLRVGLNLLQKSSEPLKQALKTSFEVQKPNTASMSLDLHGLRAEEALDRLDKFISDALIAGFDEVIVYHGIGTGKLAYAVKEFLKAHKSVKSFSDAPINQGGYGAKVVRL